MLTLGTKLNGPASASASSTSFHAAWTKFKAPRSGTTRFGPKLAVPWFAAFPTASSSLQMNDRFLYSQSFTWRVIRLSGSSA